MSRYRSHEEVREEYVRLMGPELGEIFHTLTIELTWIHWHWKQYRILFGDQETRLDLLNQSAPFFFALIQLVLHEDTLLSIARLVAAPRSAGNPNLTIRRLPTLVALEHDGDRVEELVGDAVSATDFAVKWRNRRLAHRDLDLALGKAVEPLPPSSREAVEGALAALRELLNHVEQCYAQSTTAYDASPLTGDAESLLHTLQAGQLRQEDRDAKHERGEMHEDDINPPPPV